jgi:hypothetical protein
MLTWEQIDSVPANFTVYRAKVPGGWLISINLHDGQGLTFYPDPNHEWGVKTLDEAYAER